MSFSFVVIFTASFVTVSSSVLLPWSADATCVSASSIFIASISVTLITAASNAVLNFAAFSGFAKRIANTSVFVSSSRTKIRIVIGLFLRIRFAGIEKMFYLKFQI